VLSDCRGDAIRHSRGMPMAGPDYKPPRLTLPAQWKGSDSEMKDAAKEGPKDRFATVVEGFDDILSTPLSSRRSRQTGERSRWSNSPRARLPGDKAGGLYPSMRDVGRLHSGSDIAPTHARSVEFSQIIPLKRTRTKTGSTRAGKLGCLWRYPARASKRRSRAGCIDRERARRQVSPTGRGG